MRRGARPHAIQAKLDELLRADGNARTELTTTDEEPERFGETINR